jgi:hypothetical protein
MKEYTVYLRKNRWCFTYHAYDEMNEYLFWAGEKWMFNSNMDPYLIHDKNTVETTEGMPQEAKHKLISQIVFDKDGDYI